MAIKAKIQLDNSELKAGLKQAENQASKTGNALNKNLGKDKGKSLDDLGKSANDAVKVLDKFAQSTVGAGTGIGGLAGDIVNLVKNPMAMLITAFGVVATVGKKLWDDLTLSTQEAIEKTALWAAATQKAVQELEKQHTETESLIDSFIELNNVIPKSSAYFSAQKLILSKLQSVYGDLGYKINETKQEVEGLLDALIQIEQIKHKQKVEKYGQALQVAHVQAQQLNTEFYTNNSTALAKNKKLSEKYNQAQESDAHNAMAVQERYNKFAERTFVENGKKLFVNPQEELAFLKQLRKGGAETGVNTTEQIKQLDQYIKALEKVVQLEKQLNNIKKFGTANPETAQRKTLDLFKVMGDAEIARNAIKEERAFRDASLQKKLNSGGSYSDRVKTSKTQLDEFNKLKDKAQENLTAAQKQANDALNALKQIENKIKNKEISQGEAFPVVQVLIKNLNGATAVLDQVSKKYSDMKEQAALMKKQHDTLADEENKFYSDKIQNLDREIRLQQLVLQGRDSLIKRQKILNELTNKGFTLTNQQLDEMIRKQTKLGALKLRQQQQEEGHNIIAQSMRLMGQERQAMEYEAIRIAKKQKGAALDQQQLTRVRSLVGLKYELSKIGSWDLQTTGTLTNELAARGGFNSSVHTDSKYDVNQQIYNKTQGIYQTLQTIPQLLRNMGVIQ